MINEPLGLPKGSIRAILSLVIVISSLIFAFTRNEFPEYLSTILAMVLTYYFVKREDETRGK